MPPTGSSCQAVNSAMRVPPRAPGAGRRPRSCAPSVSTAASCRCSSVGSPSADATAPSMTMFTKPEPRPAARRVAGTHSTSTPASSGGAVSAFTSTRPSVARPSATPASPTSDGSSTTTRSGSVTESWRRMGRSEMRVNARSGAPRRSGPYSGNACTPLPSRSSASARIWAAVLAPCPARACQRISVSSRIATTPRGWRRRAWPRAQPGRRWRRR